MAYYNPFQGKDLKFPKKYKDKVEGYCQTRPSGGKKPSIEESPFRRQVDLWYLAICIGVCNDKKKSDVQSYRFITGEVLANNPEKIENLELIAIANSHDPYIIGRPNDLVELMNDYAAAGIEILFNVLNSGSSRPLWNLCDYLYYQFKLTK
jgi:hypothetical protein